MRVPILFYHKINHPHPEAKIRGLYVTPENFYRQMRYLKWRDYTPISLYELVKGINLKEKLSSKSIVLTFDDGYEDNYTYAFPILKKFSFTATIFLVTRDIGGLSGWADNEETVKEQLLSWDKIKEMADYGIDFQAHTHSHPSLTELDEQRIKEEIVNSKDIIQKQLGKNVDFLCYPYGHFNPQIKRILKEVGYLGALSTKRGMVKEKDDPYCLKRIGIKDKGGILTFIRYIEFKYR